MKIKVKLYTILKKYGKDMVDKDNNMSIPSNLTLKGLMSRLEIPKKMGKVLLVNGFPRDIEYKLHEGDEVKILSFIGGG